MFRSWIAHTFGRLFSLRGIIVSVASDVTSVSIMSVRPRSSFFASLSDSALGLVVTVIAIARRNLDLEALERDQRYMLAQKWHHAAFNAEAAHGDQRRHVRSSLVPDRQAGALGTQPRQDSQLQTVELHFAVKSIRQHRDQLGAGRF